LRLETGEFELALMYSQQQLGAAGTRQKMGRSVLPKDFVIWDSTRFKILSRWRIFFLPPCSRPKIFLA
jgi:hypothetical protein